MKISFEYMDSTYDFVVHREERYALDVFRKPLRTFINIIPF